MTGDAVATFVARAGQHERMFWLDGGGVPAVVGPPVGAGIPLR